MIGPALQADLDQGIHRALAAFLGGNALIDQRQFDVLKGCGARQQVEALKDEPQKMPPQQRPLIAVKPSDIGAEQQVLAGSRRIKATQNVHRTRLARAGGAHDGNELALLHGEVDVVERIDLRLVHAVDLGQMAQFQHGGGCGCHRLLCAVMTRSPAVNGPSRTWVVSPSVTPVFTAMRVGSPSFRM